MTMTTTSTTRNETQCTSIFVTFMEKNRRNISKCTQYETIYVINTLVLLSTHTMVRDFIICWTWHKWRWLFYCIHKRTVYNLLCRRSLIFDLNLFSISIQVNVVCARREINVTCAASFVAVVIVFTNVTCNFMRKLISIKWSSHKTCEQERNFCRKIPSLIVCVLGKKWKTFPSIQFTTSSKWFSYVFDFPISRFWL